MEQPATPNPAAAPAGTEKNPKKLQKSGSSVEVEAVAAEETSDGAAEASNAVNNEV